MPTFDGENLIITLDAGITEVDVIDDLYEKWKDWMLASPVNRKYPQAFLSDGGNPLSSIINQGSYIFLQNSYGWRIKPPEENITIYFTGNLAVVDTTLPAFNPTDGNYTAAILGLQPVTQGVTETMAGQLEYGSFNGGVTVDIINGYPGTSYVDGHPIGSSEYPSNNVQDAVTIDVNKGLPKTIFIIGDLTLDSGDNVSGFMLVGQNAARTTLTILPSAIVSNTEIRECAVTGTLDGNSIIRNCSIFGDLDYFSGFIHETEISGTITLGSNAQASILGCYSGVPGQATPTIDFGGSGQTLSLRKYSGGIKIQNKTGSDAASIDLIGGQVRIDLTTVINGSLVVRGTGKVVDDLNNDWLPHGTYGSLILDNETTYGLLLQEIWTLMGLDPDVPVTITPASQLAGAIDLLLGGDGIATTTITRQ